MNEMFLDTGFVSINKYKEYLCGDSVEIVKVSDDQVIAVLADGLGSGVKANILSTLTSKMITSMMAKKMPLHTCIEAITNTLPVCKVRNIAYSTFTIVKIENQKHVDVINYDNPRIILIKDHKIFNLRHTKTFINGKSIYQSSFDLGIDDAIIVLSDGCVHAGIGNHYDFGWRIENIEDFLIENYKPDLSAKTISTLLIDQCQKLYYGTPGDDATVCTLKLSKSRVVNLMIGPPEDRHKDAIMFDIFLRKQGKKIVCGGTTAQILAKHMKKEIQINYKFGQHKLPPTASIEGVDLVTEGIITINEVLKYAMDYCNENKLYKTWKQQDDGASLIAKLLFVEATHINFFVGKAVNPAHQNPDLPINFTIKMNLVERLETYLRQMNKHVKINYF